MGLSHSRHRRDAIGAARPRSESKELQRVANSPPTENEASSPERTSPPLSLVAVRRQGRVAQAASRRRAFCTGRQRAPFARANGRARKSTLAGLAAIVISSPVAGLRPLRAFCAGLTRNRQLDDTADPHVLGVAELTRARSHRAPASARFASFLLKLCAVSDGGRKLRLC